MAHTNFTIQLEMGAKAERFTSDLILKHANRHTTSHNSFLPPNSIYRRCEVGLGLFETVLARPHHVICPTAQRQTGAAHWHDGQNAGVCHAHFVVPTPDLNFSGILEAMNGQAGRCTPHAEARVGPATIGLRHDTARARLIRRMQPLR